LTDESLKNAELPLEVRIQADKTARTLTITDRGVGMTKEDLISNLGTVARSGTSNFLQAVSSGTDAVSLIGQFGVGFYSAFLVADTVTVTSKQANDTQYVWESDAKSSFKVYPDPEGETLGSHGTRITLHLKDNADEYLEEDKLEAVLKHYSEFIEFPIYLHKVKTVTEEVPNDEVPETDAEEDDTTADKPADDEVEAEDVDDEPVDNPSPTKTIERTVDEWEQMNAQKPIWTRPKSEVSEEAYAQFYKTLNKEDKEAALAHSHFKAEGGVEFSSLLYIPGTAPADLYDKFYSTSHSLKLYVRRVLVQSEFDELLPRYLNFVQGVVDSDDLPISVSRETIQKSKVLNVIGKKVTRSILKMLEDLAADTTVEDVEGDEADDKKAPLTRYEKFWAQFGRSIRLGLMEDKKNSKKLMNLLRYTSVQSPTKVISLEQYVENMPDNQEFIYYITGSSQKDVENSPMLEQLKKRGFDVLYFVDNIDGYVTSALDKFDDKELVSVTKEGLKFGDDDDEESEKALKEEFEKTTKWFIKVLGKDEVNKCIVSKRVASSPAVVVSPKWGWDANMIRIMQAQTFSGFEQQAFMAGNRVLEINPYHPIIIAIKDRLDAVSTDEDMEEEESTDEELEEMAKFVYDAALLGSGYSHKNNEVFVARLNTMVAKSLGVEDAPIVEPKPKAPKPASTEDDDDQAKDEL
jgi:heat shock protein beta